MGRSLILLFNDGAEAKEGAGRNYEATCAASISRLMIMCYEVLIIPKPGRIDRYTSLIPILS